MVRQAKTGELVKRIAGYAAMALSVLGLLLIPRGVHAASLYFSPSAQNVTVGQTMVVAVGVSSADQAMNAVSGDISFPTSQLQVISVSKNNSIISLWVKDPSFTNSGATGNIHFEGIVLNPGFTGAAGAIVHVTFQAVAAGNASVSFSDGSVLANDGNGTNILTSLGAAHFSIAPGSSVAKTDVTPPEPFTIAEISGEDSPNPQPIFTWHATDTGSGIGNYMVQIGNGAWIDASTLAIPSTTDEYRLPPQAPALNIPLAVEAFDKAGNMQLATTSFSVASPSVPQSVYCAVKFSLDDLYACGWFGIALAFFLEWGALILALFIILALVVFAIYTIVHRLRIWHLSSSRELLKMREELRADLRRMEQEMKNDQGTITKERVQQEIGHIEKDIKEDIDRLNETEKLD